MRHAIREVQPLLLECHAQHPGARGTLTITMRLAGDAAGTVVDTVEVAGVDGEGLLVCMRETLYTLALPAMPGADVWDVIYPLHLLP